MQTQDHVGKKSKNNSSTEDSTQSENDSALQMMDNRSEAIQMQQLQELSDNSSQVNDAVQLQSMADNFTIEKEPLQRKENKTGLPDNLKTGMESLSGISLDSVNVHRNSALPAQLNAHAYAQGTDIHLGSGQEKHLPHELGHVVQQAQGRVKPTTDLGGMPVNDSVGLEKEADMMGARALQLKSFDLLPQLNPVTSSNNDVSQMMMDLKTFKEQTNGGMFVKRGSGVTNIDDMIGLYDKLQLNPSTKKADLTWQLEHIGKIVEAWIDYHKDEYRQSTRVDKFKEFLDGSYKTEKDETLPARPEDDEELSLTDGSKVWKALTEKKDSDAIAELKFKHEGSADMLFNTLGGKVNALVPSDGDGAKLDVAVKIPIPIAPMIMGSIGGGLTLEAQKDGGMVTTKAAVNLTAGVEFAKAVGFEGKLEGFVESKAATADEAIELMSYGLYQRSRAGKTPSQMTNAIWGGDTGSLGFGASEQKMAEKEVRIFGPIKEKRDKINGRLNTAKEDLERARIGNDLTVTNALIAKVEGINKELSAINATLPEVTSGGVAAIKAEFGGGVMKAEIEVARSSGTKISLDQIEESKGDKFGEARDREGAKKKMGQNAVSWEAKGSLDIGGLGKVEVGYKMDWAGGEAKTVLSGSVEGVLPLGTIKDAAPYILAMYTKGGAFIANMKDDKDVGETSAESIMVGQAMSLGSIALADPVTPKLKEYDGVGGPEPKPGAPQEGAKAKGTTKLKIKIGLEDLKKVSFELSYVNEIAASTNPIIEVKMEKSQRLIKHEWNL